MQCGTAGPTKVAVWQQICGNEVESNHSQRLQRKHPTAHKEIEASVVECVSLESAPTGSWFERKRKRKQAWEGDLKHKNKKRKKKKWAPHGSMELSSYSHEKEKGRKEKNSEWGKKENTEMGRGRESMRKGKKGTAREESLSMNQQIWYEIELQKPKTEDKCSTLESNRN